MNALTVVRLLTLRTGVKKDRDVLRSIVLLPGDDFYDGPAEAVLVPDDDGFAIQEILVDVRAQLSADPAKIPHGYWFRWSQEHHIINGTNGGPNGS